MTSQSSAQSGPAPKGRLISHFETQQIEKHGAAWSSLWDSNESDLWDRGKASPALVDIIEERSDLFSPSTSDGRRKRVLVPGCGRGYDVVMLALHGFDAYGLEISSTAVRTAEEYAKEQLKEPAEYHFGIRTKDKDKETMTANRGKIAFVQGDFFQSDWETKTEDVSSRATKFDLIYDYTFLCALHPSMRKHWARRMGELLAPGGMLVCLEFPMYKDLKLPGPPWGLNGVHYDLLAKGGTGLLTGDHHDQAAEEDDEEQQDHRGQFNRILYVKPARTYEVGKGTDMLSVYERK